MINAAFLTKQSLKSKSSISLGDKRMLKKHHKKAFESGLSTLLLNAIASNHPHLFHLLNIEYLPLLQKTNILEAHARLLASMEY